MVDQNVIKIKGGRYRFATRFPLISLTRIRHILQEITVSSYVPNDTYLMGGNESNTDEGASSMDQNPSMLMLTGPNYSGKSAYIKQASDHSFQTETII
jgi:DNA mismatch repair protein MSH5